MSKPRFRGNVAVGIALSNGTWSTMTFQTCMTREELSVQDVLFKEAKACLDLGNLVAFVAMLSYKALPDNPLDDYEAPFAVQGWFEESDAVSYLRVVDLNEHEVCRVMRLTARPDTEINKSQYVLATQIARLLTISAKEDK